LSRRSNRRHAAVVGGHWAGQLRNGDGKLSGERGGVGNSGDGEIWRSVQRGDVHGVDTGDPAVRRGESARCCAPPWEIIIWSAYPRFFEPWAKDVRPALRSGRGGLWNTGSSNCGLKRYVLRFASNHGECGVRRGTGVNAGGKRALRVQNPATDASGTEQATYRARTDEVATLLY